MHKRFFLAIPLMVAALALAQNAGVVGAKGEGIARSEDGRTGKFAFQMAKATRPNGESKIEGRLRFESNVPNVGDRPGRHVVIEMGNARVLGKHENVVEFGGPGMIIVRTHDGVVRKEGRVSVRVQDRKRPDANRDRQDLFRIRFDVANSDGFYQFDGAVARGDIQVFMRPN